MTLSFKKTKTIVRLNSNLQNKILMKTIFENLSPIDWLNGTEVIPKRLWGLVLVSFHQSSE